MKDFSYYLRTGDVKKQRKNIILSESLMKQAEERLDYISTQEMRNKIVRFIIEDIYESMREAVESLMILQGFKSYSHEATVSFLQKFPKEIIRSDIEELDRLRKIRNDIMYRAKNVDIIEGRSALNFAKKLFPKLQKILKRLI